MTRVALIGCGSHSGQHHAAPLAHYVSRHPGEVELAAACDLDLAKAEHFCELYGFRRAYTDLERMLAAERPDLVVCVMPIPLVTPVATLLLERGVPCTIEKPFGLTLADAAALRDAAVRTGTPHMVSMNRRFAPYLVRAAQWVGEAGPLLYLRALMARVARTETRFTWGTGVHAVDAVRHFGGEVSESRVTTQRTPGGRLWIHLELSHAGGARGDVTLVPTSGRQEERYEFVSEGRFAEVYLPRSAGPAGARLSCWEGGKLVIDESPADDVPGFMLNGAYHETCALLDRWRRGEPLTPTAADVFESLRLCDVAEE